MSIETIAYMGLENCMKLSNGTVDIIATTAVGPRILFYGATGGKNLLGEHPESSVQTALGTWKPYGGHRLWVWPELFPATYAPDSDPIEYVAQGDSGLTLSQPLDRSGIKKEMSIMLAPTGSHVQLSHTITSENLWPIEIAPWAITVVASGTAIVPRVPFRSHDDFVAAAQPLTLNAFTDLQDSRFVLGSRYILLSADAALTNSQKFGLRNKEGWCAHLYEDSLFVKRFAHDEQATYPDYGSNNEVYVAGSFMEVELLGPVRAVAPGASVSLTEEWHLFQDVGLAGARDLERLHQVIEPLIQSLS